MSLSVSRSLYSSKLSLYIHGRVGESIIGGYASVAELLAMVAIQQAPVYGYVYNLTAYKHVYEDRRGVGWMAYLPHRLTQQDVPEARAVIPVRRDTEQVGSVLVSVTDAVFNPRLPEHMEAARAIETRLVSMDLLPTFQQLLRPPES